jgi:glycosyltransferase involved in cell wall biosynthesis
MNNPLVSIIMPTLNAGKYLGEALLSVQNQKYKNYEIILVDGGSTDNTISISRQFNGIKLITQTGKGLTDAWNCGINSASGDLIAFLDSDDKFEEDCIENHIKLYQENTSITCTIGYMEFFIQQNQAPPPEFKMSLLNQRHLGYMPGCFFGRRDVFDRLGLFETQWKIVSDIVWFAKLKKSAEQIGIIEQVVLKKRVHQENLLYTTAHTPVYDSDLLKFLHTSIKNS